MTSRNSAQTAPYCFAKSFHPELRLFCPWSLMARTNTQSPGKSIPPLAPVAPMEQDPLQSHAPRDLNRESLSQALDIGINDHTLRQILAFSQRHDVETGLLNYYSLQEELGSLLREVPAGEEVSVVWIDLLNLRREYSLWGWDAAGALSRTVAKSITSTLGKDALVGRVGGRSFVFAMRAGKSDPAARKRIQQVVDGISQVDAHGLEGAPEVVAGVAFFPFDAPSPGELIRFASVAAARAQYTNSASVVPFQLGMNSDLLRRHKLEVEIGKALAEDQFTMFYQPKIDLTNGKVLGAEALMRWNHPEWGPIAPAEFIPVAERSSLIHRLFDISLRSALERAREWNQAGIAPGIVAVNVSCANLRRDDFSRRVRTLMAELPIAPVELELEITESLLLDDEELFASRMRQLKAIGVRLAIDDFGTRYTGFNLLKRLPLDAMKIDCCFIRGVHRSQDMRVLCSAIVAVAKQMKLRTVAEGLEDREELEVMREIGCDAGQGFLFQRPLPPNEFEKFLRTWPTRSLEFGFADSRETQRVEPL